MYTNNFARIIACAFILSNNISAQEEVFNVDVFHRITKPPVSIKISKEVSVSKLKWSLGVSADADCIINGKLASNYFSLDKGNCAGKTIIITKNNDWKNCLVGHEDLGRFNISFHHVLNSDIKESEISEDKLAKITKCLFLGSKKTKINTIWEIITNEMKELAPNITKSVLAGVPYAMYDNKFIVMGYDIGMYLKSDNQELHIFSHPGCARQYVNYLANKTGYKINSENGSLEQKNDVSQISTTPLSVCF